MDEKRTDLKSALRELAAEESGDAGPHVGSKRLIAYREGTLPPAEREAIEEHLSLCPRCTGLLLELRDFEAASAQGDADSESLRQDAWDSLVRSLPEKTPVVRPIADAARREAQPPRRLPFFVAGIAAALLLAAAGLWLARLEQRLEERDAALATLQRSLVETERQLDAARRQIQDLGQPGGREAELETRIAELTAKLEELRRTSQALERREQIAAVSRDIAVSIAPRFVLRGQEPTGAGFLRGGGAVNPVRKPPREDRFAVALRLSDHPAYDEYRLELLGRDGKLLWAGRRPGSSLLGDDGTSVSFDGLGPGLYRLRIEGLHPDRSELVAEYLLQVET